MSGFVIHLIRHGEVHNPQNVLYGRMTRFGLTARGRQQAQAAGSFLKTRPVLALYSSPLLRARQTAAEIGRVIHLRPQISSLINEVLTPFEGLPLTEVAARRGDVDFNGLSGRFEKPGEVLTRMQRFLRRCRSRHPGGEVAVVTHGDVIVFTVLWALELELTARSKNRLRNSGYAASYPAHGSITRLIFEKAQERPSLDYHAVTA